MEIARKPYYVATWNGKDVTRSLSGILSSIEYVDHEEAMSDELSITIVDKDKIWLSDNLPQKGDVITMAMGYRDNLFNCGTFEVDEINASGPPDVISIKCIATAFSGNIRTQNNHVFKSQTLYRIVTFIANKYGFTVMDKSGTLKKVIVKHKTQEEISDLHFLAKLAKDYGYIFSVRDKKMLFTLYSQLDNMPPVTDIWDDMISSYSFSAKMSETYKNAEVSSYDKSTGKTSVVKQTMTEYGTEISTMDTVRASVSGTTSEIESKTAAILWRKNKLVSTANIYMDGAPQMEASKNVNLCGFGLMSGKYHITSATHAIADGAYTTTLELRRTGNVASAKKVRRSKKKAHKKMEYANDGIKEGWD